MNFTTREKFVLGTCAVLLGALAVTTYLAANQ